MDLDGPNARPWIYKGQGQIKYEFSHPTDPLNYPTGLYGFVSAETPSPDISLPTHYTTFSECPDIVATMTYLNGEAVTDTCTNTKKLNESGHIQIGALARDLGVESDGTGVAPARNQTIGWGTQLSGQYSLFRERGPCSDFTDHAFFSITYGDGISHYFNDLHLVSATNDAVYSTTTHSIETLPILAYYAAYQHDWTDRLRSTAIYSHLDLHSLPEGSTGYRSGDYMSVNLIYHLDSCTPASTKGAAGTEHHFFAGTEYLYGRREDVSGNAGSDQRVVVEFGASL